MSAAKGSFKAVVIIVLVAFLCGGFWYYQASQDEARAQALCSDIADGLESGNANGLLGLLAADYDVEAHWPIVQRAARTTPGSDDADRRQVIKRLLVRWFLSRRGERRVATCHLENLQPVTDGSVDLDHLPAPQQADLAATVTLGVERDDGREILPDTTIVFWLRRDGALLPGAQIVAHELVSTSRIR